MNSRFTIDGSDALEKDLAQICDRVAAGVRQIIPNGRLEALLLGGGYGRGQGGVLKTESQDKPYNDLEFYVCLRGNDLLNQQKYSRAFHHLGETLSPQAGLEVEFKISSAKKLKAMPPTMFSYDLACGHRCLIGDDFFQKNSRYEASEIRLIESTRLMMNRCSGLLFAKERLQRKRFTDDDADFAGRNHAKAQLGFGDAFLAAHGKYHWDCHERNRRLMNFSPEHKLPWMEDVRRHHEIGVEFKLHPHRSRASMELLCDNQRALTHLGSKIWLWLESQRLGTTFTSAREYALSQFDKCPETNPLRNILVNAKTFGPAIVWERKAMRYPRQRLLHSLALLLWEPTSLTNPVLCQRLQMELNANAVTYPDFVRAYETLWRKFN